MKRQRFGDLDSVVAGGTDGRGGGSGPVVVLLHGFGAPGEDLVGLERALSVPSETRFVYLAAPLELGGPYGDGRAWWHIDIGRFQRAQATGSYDSLLVEEPAGLAEAREKVLAALDAIERTLGVDATNIVIGGFSQGAILSTDIVLSTDRAFAGLVAMSPTIVARDRWVQALATRRKLPVFVSHGQGDPILPFEVSARWKQALDLAEWRSTWVPFRGGHAIPGEVLSALSMFVREAFASTERR